MNKSFYSNGKLLLTGEYVVLDGAMALAIPTGYGQTLNVKIAKNEGLHWKSFDEKREVWFEDVFDLNNLEGKNAQNPTSKTLSQILQSAKKLNSDFLSAGHGFEVSTHLDFPRNWGLGTSSTLINNIAQWSKTDGFKLLANSFGGSGYDIAAAQNDFPIFYKFDKNKPKINRVDLDWDFKDSLFFVHLNKKQDSKKGIAHYKNAGTERDVIRRISEIGMEVAQCRSLEQFENLMNEHERIISKTIGIAPVKEMLFRDYPFTVKSLGAWGGDFILATGNKENWNYFKGKGFKTIFSFSEMTTLKS